ncbi:transporter substrate-binding domain-containing protein [Cellulomonas bogoriensis]|uniref:ABC transporter substrate-binding protein n=1 Tax=Cellulomonas bogoriensis 69B4 = DSM 16987 TaxID=1386082 RepID=A0A0A0BPF8_9CELL|nr:ABC transporter substrate-binding protein [Cellulomonas bogoriensis 69B4 = DSM 16987]
MSNRRRALTAGASILALGLVAACTNDGGANGEGDATATGGTTTLQAAQSAGSITVGFAGEAPYSFEDENGELTGATVALHREIFAELGIPEINGQQAEFGQLIPGLTAGRFDVISAGMSILPARCEQAAFSEPEFMYTTALMVPEGNPEGLTDLSSAVEADGLTIATMSGAIETDYAESLGLDSMQVGGPQDGMDAVAGGRADAFALTGISLNWMADNNPGSGVEVTESFVQEIDGVPQVGAGGTVFRQDDGDLLEAYNEVLAEIVADEERYLSIVGEFGFTAEERPTGDLTTADLCAGDIE